MEENNCDERTARKAVCTKVETKPEKGAPVALGIAPYGLTDILVDKRENALRSLEDFMSAYLSAVDKIR